MRHRLPLLVLLVALLHVVAIVTMSAYAISSPQPMFDEPVDWAAVGRGVAALDGSTILAETPRWQLLMLGMMCAGVGVCFLPAARFISGRTLFFGLQPLVFGHSLVGIVLLAALPFEIAGGLDGEWLGESVPLLITGGLWVLLSAIVFIRDLWRWRASVSAGDAVPA